MNSFGTSVSQTANPFEIVWIIDIPSSVKNDVFVSRISHSLFDFMKPFARERWADSVVFVKMCKCLPRSIFGGPESFSMPRKDVCHPASPFYGAEKLESKQYRESPSEMRAKNTSRSLFCSAAMNHSSAIASLPSWNPSANYLLFSLSFVWRAVRALAAQRPY